MASLAGIVGSNATGFLHRLGKVDRAVRASSNHLFDKVFLEKESTHRVAVSETISINLTWGTPDLQRLKRCFESIAYGLHRHHFEENFSGSITVLPGYLREKAHNNQEFVALVRDLSERDLADSPKIGSNPQVFYYQVSSPDQYGFYMMLLCFYGGLNVYVAFSPPDTNPPNDFALSLIEQGIPTFVETPKRIFIFNPPSVDGDVEP